MTQNYGPPGGYPMNYAIPPVQRPTSVTVLSIIGIILAALALLCTPFQFIGLLVDTGLPNPQVDAIKENTLILALTIGVSVIGLLMAVVLLASSIGSLKLKPWARKGMIAYSIITIILTIVNTVVQVAVVMPEMMNSPQMAQLSDQERQMATVIGGGVGLFCGISIGTIFPIFVLIFFNRRNVKEAFAGLKSYSNQGYGGPGMPPSSMPPPPPPPPPASS